MINISKEEYKIKRKDLVMALKQTEKSKLTSIRINNSGETKDISLEEGALKFIEYLLSNHICSFEEIKTALDGKSKYQYISDDINNVYNKQMYMEFSIDGVQYYSYKDFDKEVVIIRMMLVCYAAAVKMNDMSLLEKMQIEYSDKRYMISDLLDINTKTIKDQLIAEWVINEKNECSFEDLFNETVLEKKPCRDTLAAVIEYICKTYFKDSLELLLDSQSSVYEIKDEKRRTFYNNIDTSEPILRKGLSDSAPRAIENVKQIKIDDKTIYYRIQDAKTVLEKIFDIVFAKQQNAISFEINIESSLESKNEQELGNALADGDVQMKSYWIYAPGEGAYMWEDFYKTGIMAIGWGEIGDLKTFATKEEMKDKLKETFDPERSYKNIALATWQFANEIKPGDIVFVKKGMHEIIGRGIVTSDYKYDESVDSEFKNIRQVNWVDKGTWKHNGQAVMKTLTDITAYTDYVEQLKTLFENDFDDEIEEVEEEYPTYTRENFLDDVYMDEGSYDTLTGLIRKKKNVILQGAPGVGKTFTAKRLAYSMIGHKNQERVMLVQFHQSYSYEDFIEGYRPTKSGGFDIKKGSFYTFCKRAEENPKKDFFFIIDEINRGNLSKIFGELFMLIECDKRGNSLQLLYSDEKFNVPKNVYLIGMMNTADRSLAMLDYALRRRFAFYEMKPGFESEGFKKYRTSLDSPQFVKLINCVSKLNDVISTDESLGEGFCIGHSHFCDLSIIDSRTLEDIVEYELIPLLKEYWFDEPQKVEDWTDNLRRAIN